MKLKVCGMKYQENIEAVANLQPDYLGFIFYDKSARYFNASIPELPDSIKKVGVFVNEELDIVIEKVKHFNLQAVQLHGSETPDYCFQLKEKYFTNFNRTIEIIKVFSIKDEFNFDVLRPYESVCDYYLFDTKGKLPGGNGYTFNWNVLANYPSTKPFFLSGGLGLSEVDNIKTFRESPASRYCYALDVNSKFEIEAGLKDLKLLNQFRDQLFSNSKK